MKVLHVISGLTGGGAETMLAKLAVAHRREGVRSVIACLGPEGLTSVRLREAGIEVRALGMAKNLLFPFRFSRLTDLVREIDPDVIQGWMYHGNLAASAAHRLAGSRARVFWSVHQSLYALRYESLVNAAAIRASALLSHLPERIVYVARGAPAQHARRGFRADKARVIPIGFQIPAAAPLDAEQKEKARARLGLDPAGPLAGLVARLDPKKDVGNFLEAAALAASRFPAARFLLLGRGMDSPILRARARALGVERSFEFVDEQANIGAWMGALDVLVSASYTEGFPNVIGEAMVAGVPCVVTDVGDSGWLLGDAGMVVPPRDAAALAGAMVGMFQAGPEARAALGALGRRRIEERFSIDVVAGRYLDLYLSR